MFEIVLGARGTGKIYRLKERVLGMTKQELRNECDKLRYLIEQLKYPISSKQLDRIDDQCYEIVECTKKIRKVIKEVDKL